MMNPHTETAAAQLSDIVWCYSTDAPFIAGFTSQGMRYQGTISSNISYVTPSVPDPLAVAKSEISIAGHVSPIPWLAQFGIANASAHSSAYKAQQTQQINAFKALGITSVHHDDGEMQRWSTGYTWAGGDWGPEALASFGVPDYRNQVLAAGVTAPAFPWDAVPVTDRRFPADSNSAYTMTARWGGEWTAPTGAWPLRAEWKAHQSNAVLTYHRELKAVIGAGAYTSNMYDPRPTEFSLGQLREVDGALFETDPPAGSEKWDRICMNIKSVQGLGRLCLPHLQPMAQGPAVSPQPTRLELVSVLRQQMAMVYALGAVPTYPLDVYRIGWGLTNDNDRFWGKLSEFGDITQFVAANQSLFNDVVTPGRVLLAFDLDFVHGSSQIALWRSWCDAMLRAGVSFGFYLLGGVAGVRRPEVEASAVAIIKAHADTAAFTGLPAHKTFTLAQMPTSRWVDWSMARLTGTFTNVFVVPRRIGRSLIVHVCNFDMSGGATLARAGLSLELLPPCIIGPVQSVTVFRPGQAPVVPAVTATTRGLAFALPSILEWAVIRVEY
jgi:hypothetical protein